MRFIVLWQRLTHELHCKILSLCGQKLHVYVWIMTFCNLKSAFLMSPRHFSAFTLHLFWSCWMGLIIYFSGTTTIRMLHILMQLLFTSSMTSFTELLQSTGWNLSIVAHVNPLTERIHALSVSCEPLSLTEFTNKPHFSAISHPDQILRDYTDLA